MQQGTYIVYPIEGATSSTRREAELAESLMPRAPADLTPHANKMARKAIRRGQWHSARRDVMVGVPAGINRRTGQPHEHSAEIARRARQFIHKLWSVGTQPGTDGLSLLRAVG